MSSGAWATPTRARTAAGGRPPPLLPQRRRRRSNLSTTRSPRAPENEGDAFIAQAIFSLRAPLARSLVRKDEPGYARPTMRSRWPVLPVLVLIGCITLAATGIPQAAGA